MSGQPAPAWRRVASRDEATDLAAELLSPDRDHVVVLISTAASSSDPLIDVTAVTVALGGAAEVVVITTGKTTRALEEALPPKTHVHSGAGRAYPVGNSWHHHLADSPLRMARTRAEAARSSSLLVADARAMSAKSARPQVATSQEVRGTVTGLDLPQLAWVRLDDGRSVNVRRSDLTGRVPLERIVTVGMKVTGHLDTTTGVLSIHSSLIRPAQALSSYRAGDVVLARVADVEDRVASLALVPGVNVRMTTDDVSSNPADKLTDLLSVGEVVAARVLTAGTPDGRGWHLSMLDVDDDEPPAAAPSLLPGGPPWLAAAQLDVLIPELSERVRPVPQPQEVRTRADDGADQLRAELAAVSRDKQVLSDQLAALNAEADEMAAQISDLEHALARSRTNLRKTRTKSAPSCAPDDSALFTEPIDQLRFEVHVAWARRIPAAEKARLPLPDYDVAETFLPSMAATEGVSRAKVLDVVVEVLTGLAQDIPARALHRLRVGGGGSDAPREHPTMGTAWRVNLQTGSASARRLHFWRAASGRVTLAKIGLHDDMDI